jgi:DNA topoisomerase-2
METTITEFLQNQYKEYSIYTIENRAIPGIDGLKPIQRKIIHVANNIWKTGNEKTLKVFQLAGIVASEAYYHHGNASAENAIINMAQSFKNSLPLLEEDGQFGSLRSPEPGAPRYIGTKLSKNFRLLYKDFELLENKEEEGEVIEPKFFLPIIPTVLLNGSSGIAVGFSSNILNRNPNDLIEACAFLLKGRTIDTIKPYVKDFKGEFINDPENHKRWIIRGKYEVKNTTTVKITELPPSMTYEKYEEILEDLVEKKKIVSYDNNCKNGIDYTIKFTREDLATYDEEKLIKLLKLEEANTEIFTTLDEFGKIKIFESDKEIIEYFVNFRLGFYVKRKEFMLDKLKYDLKILMNRGKFIRAILENKLDIKNKTKEQLTSDIAAMNLDLIDDSYDYLLRMPLWSLTKELFEKLKLDFTAKKEEIVELEKIQPKDMYLSELKELKQKINKK